MDRGTKPMIDVSLIGLFVGGRGTQPTHEFLRLQSHYLFDHRFCRVRRPNEKGVVEGMVGFTRRNFLVPIPSAESWEALNAELLERHKLEPPRTWDDYDTIAAKMDVVRRLG